MVVLLHSLAYLPRDAQRRLQPWQLILCLSLSDKAVNITLTTDLGLHLLHLHTTRAEEVVNIFMVLLHMYFLLKQGFSSHSWLGSLQPYCQGTRRHGLVLCIIGRLASTYAFITKSLASKMTVLY